MTGTITILGTEHNSEDSFKLVSESIPSRHPDVVAVELPPGYFKDCTPDWSVTAAFNPAREETLIGLLTQRLMLDDDYWQVDEMPLAARVAVNEDLPVALIDQPFPASMDQNGRALMADTRRNVGILAREWQIHQSHLSDHRWRDLVERDLWRVGAVVSPILRYQYDVYTKALSNPLDSTRFDDVTTDIDEKQG